MKLKIITQEDGRLRKKSIAIKEINGHELSGFIKDLTETMYAADGVGIAAPQVGVNIRLIIIGIKSGPLIMINPIISRKSWKKIDGEEGCLSVPGIFGIVRRSQSLYVTFYDKLGMKHKLKAEGMLARIVQHEVDHLDGILFIDRTKNITSKDAKNTQKI